MVSYVLDLALVFDVPAGDSPIAADPDDDVFLHCAVTAGAACIVSGDQHLLDLAQYAGIPILTARAFLDRHFSDEAAGDSSALPPRRAKILPGS